MYVEAKDRESADGYKSKAGGIVGYINNGITITFTSCTNNGVVSAIGANVQLADSLCTVASATISWTNFTNNANITTDNKPDDYVKNTVGTKTGTFTGSKNA